MKCLYVTLNLLDHIGGIQNYSCQVRGVIEKKFEHCTTVSLFDKPRDESGFLGCDGKIIPFLVNVLKESWNSQFILWNHVTVYQFSTLLLLNFTKKKQFVFVYGTEVLERRLSFLKRYSLKNAQNIIAISNNTKVGLESRLNAKINNRILCCTVSPPYSSVPPIHQTGMRQKIEILSVMRFEQRKMGSLDLLGRSLGNKHLQSRYAAKIIGRGSCLDSYRASLEGQQLDKIITALGYQQNLKQFYINCDIFYLVNDGEGFGIVYLEAMAYGKVCIGSKGCGAEEVIKHGRNGFLVCPNDPRQLKNLLVEIADGQHDLKKMGEKARRYARRHFSEGKFKTQLNAILDN